MLNEKEISRDRYLMPTITNVSASSFSFVHLGRAEELKKKFSQLELAYRPDDDVA
jgi:hypothetical protein